MQWSFIFGRRKILQINSSECWTVLIHTSDKRPSHSHCYQVNDCQVTYIKNILLIKGGQYFYTEKKIRSSFCTQKYFTYKRWTVFLHWKKIRSSFCKQKYFAYKRWTVFLYWKKYVPPFVSKIFFILKGWQCLNKCTSPLITKILLLQSFTW